MYTFVKGKGWVPETEYEEWIGSDKSGRTVRLFKRRPLPGEFFFFTSKPDAHERITTHLKLYNITECPSEPEIRRDLYTDKYYTEKMYCWSGNYV